MWLLGNIFLCFFLSDFLSFVFFPLFFSRYPSSTGVFTEKWQKGFEEKNKRSTIGLQSHFQWIDDIQCTAVYVEFNTNTIDSGKCGQWIEYFWNKYVWWMCKQHCDSNWTRYCGQWYFGQWFATLESNVIVAKKTGGHVACHTTNEFG